MKKCILTAICVLITLPSAALADKSDLEEGLPTELTDAYPVGFLGREIQGIFRYERGHDGVDKFEAIPRLEIGFYRNMQFTIATPFRFGEVEPDGMGDTTLEAFWNVNQETLDLPAFAFAGAVDLDTGQDDDDGVDPTVKFVMTKHFSDTMLLHALHFNLAYQFNDNENPGQRDGRYKAVFGYSRRITNETVFITDFVREQEMEDDNELNLVEFGLRHQFNPRTVLSFGTGFGISEESPDFRGTFGIQIAF